jgi:hypothetical protein
MAETAKIGQALGLPRGSAELLTDYRGRLRVALVELGAPANADALFWACNLPAWDHSMAETAKIGQALGLPRGSAEPLTDYRGRLRIALAEQIGPHSMHERLY